MSKDHEFKPDDIVKSCKYLQMGCSFKLDGMFPCVHGSQKTPRIVSSEEINSGAATYNLIVARRRKLFETINGINDEQFTADCINNCQHLKDMNYKDVSFDYLGGEWLPGGLNIQHYTSCNARCTFCRYTQINAFNPPQYNILDVYDQFKRKGKIRGGNIIDFSGGEPTLLKNFDEIIKYFDDNNMGQVCVYSNSLIYSQVICDLLKEDKIVFTTSIETGIPSTYQKIHNISYSKVMENLIKYRNSGTHNLRLKYIITDENRTDDDMWSFIWTMLAIRPNIVMICPDFPYDDRSIPDETVKFAAKLWCMIEKFMGITPIDYTSVMLDEKLSKYKKELYCTINELKKTQDFSYDCHLYSGLEEKKALETQLSAILNSRTWRYGNRITAFIRKIFPKGSKRSVIAGKMFRTIFGK
jgi:organic radical activating enzyme